MRSLPIVVAVATLLVGTQAEANPLFPGEIQRHLNVACGTPDCTLCHTSDVGSCGTVVRPFGRWLMSQGLTCKDNSVYQVTNIDPILDEARSTQVDTNCDGKPDIDQITACDWQALEATGCDAGAGGGTAPEVPQQNVIYGCSGAGTLVPGSAALALAGLLMLAARKRRAR